ncbi:DoxX family protein [Ilumatobacter sp.]|uniref:DoxX family protein n=1 Tax=Ilumatobacter sp. TaxID=1967498 RepID=UPI003B51C807
MNDTAAADLALAVFRCGIGAVMFAHGWNHIWGGGKISGTAGWFGSMGMRPALVQAWLASVTEMAAGVALVLGLLTPLGGAGVVGTMAVAFVINHRGNGFFIFRPGEGWEYVMTLALCGMVLGAIGAGGWSLDRALGIDDDLDGWTGLALSVGAGGVGAAVLLATCWRPPPAE